MEKREVRTYEEAVSYILEIPKFTSKNTMEDTKAFLNKLGNPDRDMKIIHVAGTNGKGSVCAYLCAVLKKAGYRLGLFTSPHLVDIRERFLLDGSMVDKEAFLRAFQRIQKEMTPGYHPTFFEYLFFMAMLLFKESKVEYCILETGLGGRLDATNAVSKKEISVITHMGLDHTEYLGDTLSEIATEKAGIMHVGAPVVYWETDESIAETLADCAKKLQIPAFRVSKSDYTFLKNTNKGIDFSYRSLYYDSIRLHVNTIAGYQMENATIAIRTLEVLFEKEPLSSEIIQEGVEAAFWAGRMEEVLPDIYVDGAHNEDGIRAFLETVAMDGCTQGRCLLFGVVRDKSYENMIKEITASELFDRICVVQLKSARALPATEIAGILKENTGKAVAVYRSAKEALHSLLVEKRNGERVYIAGSLYLVGEIKELL